jgi:hypothetical protein
MSQAARLAGVDRATVRTWCDRGDLKPIKGAGRTQRLLRRDLERFLDARNRPAPRNRGHAGDRRGRAEDAATNAKPGDAAASNDAGATTRRVLGPGTDALRRLASELSGSDALQPVFEEVLENSVRLFHADRAGLWLWHPNREHPLELVAGRAHPDLIQERVERATGDSKLAGFEALRRETVIVFHDIDDPRITPEMREVYVRSGVGSLCFVPAVFRGAPLALLVVYHNTSYDWSPDETALARSFGDTIATAIGNARKTARATSAARPSPARRADRVASSSPGGSVSPRSRSSLRSAPASNRRSATSNLRAWIENLICLKFADSSLSRGV